MIMPTDGTRHKLIKILATERIRGMNTGICNNRLNSGSAIGGDRGRNGRQCEQAQRCANHLLFTGLQAQQRHQVWRRFAALGNPGIISRNHSLTRLQKGQKLAPTANCRRTPRAGQVGASARTLTQQNHSAIRPWGMSSLLKGTGFSPYINETKTMGFSPCVRTTARYRVP